MAKKQKPLLNEATVRRMMKLADMDVLGDGFISEKYNTLQEENPFGGNKDDRKRGGKYTHEDDDTQEAEDKSDDERPTSKKGKKRRKKAGLDEECYPGDHQCEENERLGQGRKRAPGSLEEEDELESELHATEDELGREDKIADEEGAELEGEVTITDEEAQDIIDLADKLKDAVGEPEVEADIEIEDELPMGGEAEEEIDLEEPGSRMYEEELYEAALKGLNIDIVDDKAEQRKALVQEAKKRIYERVVRRLLAESKK